jgi:hypothetical protein
VPAILVATPIWLFDVGGWLHTVAFVVFVVAACAGTLMIVHAWWRRRKPKPNDRERI